MLMATGQFELFKDDEHRQRSDPLLRGDILVTRTKGHTVVVLSDGAKAAAPPHPPPLEPAAEGDLLVASGSWNLRRGPGTQYEAVMTVHGGDKLDKVDPKDWILVNVGGDVLWVSPKAIQD